MPQTYNQHQNVEMLPFLQKIVYVGKKIVKGNCYKLKDT